MCMVYTLLFVVYIQQHIHPQVPEVVTWAVDTECPDTTFVVLPDVVTHLTSTVLVVKGTDTAADTAAAAAAATSAGAAADATGSSDSTSACTFEYAVDELGAVAGEDGDGDAASGAGSGDGSGSGSGSGSAAGGSGGSSLSASSSSSSQGAGAGEWQQGDSSGVIHLHQLKVSCGGGGGGGDGGCSKCSKCFVCVWGEACVVLACSMPSYTCRGHGHVFRTILQTHT